MKKEYNLTKSDYANLFNGKVPYLIQSYKYNSCIVKKIKNYIWNIFNKKKAPLNIETRMPRSYQIIVSVGGVHNLPVWGEKGMQSFIAEKNLQPGDEIIIYCMYPNSNGGYWCAGGGRYKIQKEGWIKIDNIRGT